MEELRRVVRCVLKSMCLVSSRNEKREEGGREAPEGRIEGTSINRHSLPPSLLPSLPLSFPLLCFPSLTRALFKLPSSQRFVVVNTARVEVTAAMFEVGREGGREGGRERGNGRFACTPSVSARVEVMAATKEGGREGGREGREGKERMEIWHSLWRQLPPAHVGRCPPSLPPSCHPSHLQALPLSEPPSGTDMGAITSLLVLPAMDASLAGQVQ